MKLKKEIPPLLGEKILKFFLPKGESVSVSGDYEELFTEIAQSRGKSRAIIWYWIQILKSIWAGISVHVWWSLTMFRSYLTIAVRHLKRHKIYSFINISGLAIGIAGHEGRNPQGQGYRPIPFDKKDIGRLWEKKTL